MKDLTQNQLDWLRTHHPDAFLAAWDPDNEFWEVHSVGLYWDAYGDWRFRLIEDPPEGMPEPEEEKPEPAIQVWRRKSDGRLGTLVMREEIDPGNWVVDWERGGVNISYIGKRDWEWVSDPTPQVGDMWRHDDGKFCGIDHPSVVEYLKRLIDKGQPWHLHARNWEASE